MSVCYHDPAEAAVITRPCMACDKPALFLQQYVSIWIGSDYYCTECGRCEYDGEVDMRSEFDLGERLEWIHQRMARAERRS